MTSDPSPPKGDAGGSTLTGQRLGTYQALDRIGEGGPPSLALEYSGELWRDRAEAQEARA